MRNWFGSAQHNPSKQEVGSLLANGTPSTLVHFDQRIAPVTPAATAPGSWAQLSSAQ